MRDRDRLPQPDVAGDPDWATRLGYSAGELDRCCGTDHRHVAEVLTVWNG